MAIEQVCNRGMMVVEIRLSLPMTAVDGLLSNCEATAEASAGRLALHRLAMRYSGMGQTEGFTCLCLRMHRWTCARGAELQDFRAMDGPPHRSRRRRRSSGCRAICSIRGRRR